MALLTKIALTFLVFLLPLFSFASRLEIDKMQWNVTGALLYWYGKEQGIGFTNKPAKILTTDVFTHHSVINPSSHWKPGFRLGIGYNKESRRWSFRGEWIYLESEASGKKNVNSGAPEFLGTYPIWSMGPDTLKGDYTSSSSSHWHLFTNILDLYAQYSCLHHRFELMPFAGIRGAFLSQKLKAKYSGGTFFSGADVNTLRSYYDAGGPRFGINGEYYIAYGLILFGRGAVAPLFGNILIKQKEAYLESKRFHRSSTHYHFVLSTDYAIGLKWQRAAIKDKLCTALSVAWEGEEFFYANSFYRGPHHFFVKNRHLFLQGATLTLALDF